MFPFTIDNPVKLHFGKNVLDKLPKKLEKFGKKILLIYGKNSIKKSGLYNQIINDLKDFEIIEFSGIKSNPLYKDVDKAAEIGRKENVDMILAVGGGSVIDSAKITSITIPTKCSSWDFYSGKAKPKSSIPLITILTLAATGTEMNPYAVLQNNQTKEKQGYGHPLCYAKHSFLDPSLTLSVPKNYTAYGIVDLIAHVFEQYFGEGESSLSDKFAFSVLKEAVENGEKLIQNLENYEFREKIMWAATVALNGWLNVGRKSGDWGAHAIEHALSVLYDIPHGAGLSIVYPAWLKLMSEKVSDRILEIGENVFGVHSVYETISELEEFFINIGAPIRLQEVSILEKNREEIYKTFIANKVSGVHHFLNKNDYDKLLNYMFEERE
jgi:alcohol dehydrogenase YqhD (iron-dependent ADH family)